MKVRKPTAQERAVLEAFSGTPEPWERFSGAGTVTKQSLLQMNWIRPNTDPDYDSSWFEITPEGEEALY
ncbi:hypothetical protein [Loktanella sp. R86503]|uniref:hypothetical protein n=1 Tax=Loktanella sp. R86503 TaxID=3093847 RepID=UPI0036D9B867